MDRFSWAIFSRHDAVTPRDTLDRLVQRHDLSEAQAGELLTSLTGPEINPAMAGALLAALRTKGVTAAEVRGFAAAMGALARKPDLPSGLDAIDIVGTGGDASGSLNLSTGAALLAAACGLPVVKHGNRSISSLCGSADLIEALGFKLPLDETQAARCFAATGFAFLFAPYFHPAMKSLAPIRSALGIRTVFNLLGPLTNPAAPRFRLIGAYDAARLGRSNADRSVSRLRRVARHHPPLRNRSAGIRRRSVPQRRLGRRRCRG
jgi:anthranilate phosphoribosyltransferase